MAGAAVPCALLVALLCLGGYLLTQWVELALCAIFAFVLVVIALLFTIGRPRYEVALTLTDERVVVATFHLGLVDPGSECGAGGVLAFDDDACATVADPGDVAPVLGPGLGAPFDAVVHMLGEILGDVGLEAGAGCFRGCAGPAHAGTTPALVIPASQTRSS